MNEWRRYMFLNFSLHGVYDKNGTVKHFYINIYLNVKVVNSKCTSEPAWYPHFVSQIYLSQHLHMYSNLPVSKAHRWDDVADGFGHESAWVPWFSLDLHDLLSHTGQFLSDPVHDGSFAESKIPQCGQSKAAQIFCGVPTGPNNTWTNRGTNINRKIKLPQRVPLRIFKGCPSGLTDALQWYVVNILSNGILLAVSKLSVSIHF